MSHGTARVSLVVPVFNDEKFLPQCLDSVIGQTLREIQILVVNDGSTDGSGAICRQFAERDSRIQYIEKQNGGLASARNAGLQLATGEHIGFVDADDWVEATMYERMYSIAEEHSADIVLCDSIFEGKVNRSAHLDAGYYDRDRIETEMFPYTLAGFDLDGQSRRIRWSNCLRLYRKKLVDDHSIAFDNRFRRCQDLPFTFECTLHANGIYYLGEEYLYHNRPVTDSLSKGYTEQMWGLLKPLMQYLDEIVEHYPNYDFSPQMTLRSFMFAMNCIENEAKPNNDRRLSDRLRAVRAILGDDYTREFIKKLDPDSISRLYRSYFVVTKYRLAFPAYLIAFYRLRKLRQRHRAQLRAPGHRGAAQ